MGWGAGGFCDFFSWQERAGFGALQINSMNYRGTCAMCNTGWRYMSRAHAVPEGTSAELLKFANPENTCVCAKCLWVLKSQRETAVMPVSTACKCESPESPNLDRVLLSPLEFEGWEDPAPVRVALKPFSLWNLGATCYMNSLVQQLFMITSVRRGLLLAKVLPF